MVRKFLSRPRFYWKMPLLCWLAGQCLIYSASADPPPSPNVTTTPAPSAAPIGSVDPSTSLRPKLKFNKDDFVPIPDMVEMPTDTPEEKPRPAHPLKVTIPDLDALQQARHPIPNNSPANPPPLAGASNAPPPPANTAYVTPDVSPNTTQPASVAQAAPVMPVAQSTNLPPANTATSQLQIPQVNAPAITPAAAAQLAPAAGHHTPPSQSAAHTPFPQKPTSPMATVAADPVVAVGVTTEVEPLPAYATAGKQPPANTANAYANTGRQPAAPVDVYRSPQQVANADRYSTLAPAAGTDTPAVESPLIPLTDTTQPADASPPPLKVPPAAPNAAEPGAPIPTLPTTNSQLPPTTPAHAPTESSPPSAVQPLLAAKPAPTVAPPAQAPAQAPLQIPPLPPAQAAAPVQTPPAEPAPTTTASAPAVVPPAAVRKWDGPDVVQANPQTPQPTADATEPKRMISQESKKIVDKFPAHPEKPDKSGGAPISVEHAKDLKAIDKTANVAADTKTAKDSHESHESMGIKVDVKAPRVNLDYELEKAYNALIAGRADAAVVIYKNVLQNDPNNKNALFGLATTYHRAGQLEMARPLYAKLLTIDPNHRDGMNNFLVLLADEAPEDALAQLQRLKETNPTFSPIPAQMAVICQKLGMADQASANMLHAIELEPENLTYRYNFAIMLDKQHKYDEAAQLYRQIIQAYQRGEATPGNIQKIQQRLTFISSNRP